MGVGAVLLNATIAARRVGKANGRQDRVLRGTPLAARARGRAASFEKLFEQELAAKTRFKDRDCAKARALRDEYKRLFGEEETLETLRRAAVFRGFVMKLKHFKARQARFRDSLETCRLSGISQQFVDEALRVIEEKFLSKEAPLAFNASAELALLIGEESALEILREARFYRQLAITKLHVREDVCMRLNIALDAGEGQISLPVREVVRVLSLQVDEEDFSFIRDTLRKLYEAGVFFELEETSQKFVPAIEMLFGLKEGTQPLSREQVLVELNRAAEAEPKPRARKTRGTEAFTLDGLLAIERNVLGALVRTVKEIALQQSRELRKSGIEDAERPMHTPAEATARLVDSQKKREWVYAIVSALPQYRADDAFEAKKLVLTAFEFHESKPAREGQPSKQEQILRALVEAWGLHDLQWRLNKLANPGFALKSYGTGDMPGEEDALTIGRNLMRVVGELLQLSVVERNELYNGSAGAIKTASKRLDLLVGVCCDSEKAEKHVGVLRRLVVKREQDFNVSELCEALFVLEDVAKRIDFEAKTVRLIPRINFDACAKVIGGAMDAGEPGMIKLEPEMKLSVKEVEEKTGLRVLEEAAPTARIISFRPERMQLAARSGEGTPVFAGLHMIGRKRAALALAAPSEAAQETNGGDEFVHIDKRNRAFSAARSRRRAEANEDSEGFGGTRARSRRHDDAVRVVASSNGRPRALRAPLAGGISRSAARTAMPVRRLREACNAEVRPQDLMNIIMLGTAEDVLETVRYGFGRKTSAREVARMLEAEAQHFEVRQADGEAVYVWVRGGPGRHTPVCLVSEANPARILRKHAKMIETLY